MKKICLLFAILLSFLCFSNVSFANAETDASAYVVTANKANVYEQPMFNSTVIKTLSHKTEIKIELSLDAPVEYVDGNYTFYKIDQDGYILSNLVCKKTETITSIPNFNAKTNGECFVYFLENDVYEKSDIKLSEKQEIFLYEGFDQNKDVTAIAFVNANEVLYGFIQTKYVSPNGINPVVFIVITLVMAILGIAFAWLFISGKKKHKNVIKN